MVKLGVCFFMMPCYLLCFKHIDDRILEATWKIILHTSNPKDLKTCHTHIDIFPFSKILHFDEYIAFHSLFSEIQTYQHASTSFK